MQKKNLFTQLTATAATSTTLTMAFAINIPQVDAANLFVSNADFEKPVLADGDYTTSESIPGWEIYDPSGLIPDVGVFNPPTEAYAGEAPKGKNVGFVYESQDFGSGVNGFTQILASTLKPSTIYHLKVEVGDPLDYDDFGLTGFPGYAVQLLAGGTVLTENNNTLELTEGTFNTSSISYTAATNSSLLGQPLEIRLLNLNLPQSSGREVDFDNVWLQAQAAPEPESNLGILVLGALGARLTFKNKLASAKK